MSSSKALLDIRCGTKYMLVSVWGLVVLGFIWISCFLSFSSSGARLESESRQLENGVHTNNEVHEKWIVMTSSQQAKSAILPSAKIPGWKVLVVGDSHTKLPGQRFANADWVYLSLETQKVLDYSISNRLLDGSLARKNVGYLYALAQGAKVIYDTDGASSLDTLETFSYTETMNGIVYSCPTIFNPCRHFGHPTLWPRGYPLGVAEIVADDTYRVDSRWKTPSVQRGMINGQPDTDAILELSNEQKPQDKVTFDSSAPPAMLPEGTFTPINSINTLFHKDAFWGLLLPMTLTTRVSDIWRGYWLQRLLWEIGSYAGVFPANAHRSESNPNAFGLVEVEMSMYSTTEKLLAFLSDWQCPQSSSFFQCMHQLSSDMADNQFWGQEDVELTSSWIKDLQTVGYPEPTRIGSRVNGGEVLPASPSTNHLDLSARKEMTLRRGTGLTFVSMVVRNSKTNLNFTTEISRLRKHSVKFTSLCHERHTLFIPAPVFAKRIGERFKGILLIVAVSESLISQYVDTVLKRVFQHMAFCCEKKSGSRLRSQLSSARDFTLIEVEDTKNQSIKPLCTVRAMEMGYNVEGFLVIGGDVLLNMKQLRNLRKNRAWVDKSFISVSEPSGKTKGASSKTKVDTSLVDPLLLNSIREQVLRRRYVSNSMNEVIHYLSSDMRSMGKVFYVPRALIHDVMFYFHTFKNQNTPPVNASMAAIRSVLLCNDYEAMTGHELSSLKSETLLNQVTPNVHFIFNMNTTSNLKSMCHSHFFPW